MNNVVLDSKAPLNYYQVNWPRGRFSEREEEKKKSNKEK